MTKKLLTLALAALMALTLAAPALADFQTAGDLAKEQADALDASARVVNVATWTYYVPDEVVAMFEEASGMRVNYTPVANEELLARMQAAGGQFDLIVSSDYIMSTMIALNLLAPIDAARLPNIGNVDPAYQGQYFDPEDAYTLPYTSTIPLIVYDPEAIDFEITCYADLWREEFVGNLAVIDDIRNVIGMAQKKLGYSYNETDPEKMAKVSEELASLKPNIAVFNADTPHNALIGGDAIAGFMFGSQIVAAREDMPNLKVVYPAEGLGFGIDCLAVPADAPHAEAAYIFINYLLDGQVSAYASDLIDYGSCNTAAVEFMTEEFKNDDTVNPPAELLETAEMVMPLDGEAQRLYDDIWTAFRQ